MKKFIAALVALVAMATAVAGPASAARQINPPAWFICNRYPATISISPPRVWASYRTERVLWFSQIQRWNDSTEKWYAYGNRFETWSSFTYSGMGVTSWGYKFHNSTLNLRVEHRGYYRVASVVRGMQGGVTWSGFIGGRSSNCFVR